MHGLMGWLLLYLLQQFLLEFLNWEQAPKLLVFHCLQHVISFRPVLRNTLLFINNFWQLCSINHSQSGSFSSSWSHSRLALVLGVGVGTLALKQACEGNLSYSRLYSWGSTDSRSGPDSGFATYICMALSRSLNFSELILCWLPPLSPIEWGDNNHSRGLE